MHFYKIKNYKLKKVNLVMDNYTLMKLSEKMDDDGIDIADFDPEEPYEIADDAEAFKQKYKEFYTDIKLSIKEDW